MKLNIFKTLALGALVVGFASCEKDYDKSDYDKPHPSSSNLPTVATGDASAFGESAIIEATKNELPGSLATNWGVLVSTSAEPTLAGSIKVEGDITKTTQTFSVTGLTDGTTYNYRTFVSDGVTVAYGETKSFKTDGAAWGTEQGYWAFATAEEADAYLPYRAMLAATHSSAMPFMTCNMFKLFGAEFYGVVSSVCHPELLFHEKSAQLTTYGVMNAAGFKMDFSGMFFPKVWFDAVMIQAFLDEETYPGHFDVYVSHNPIETAADLQTAVKIGSSKGTTKAHELYVTNMQTTAAAPLKFDIPMEYWGETYIYIVNTSDYTGDFSGETNLGVVVLGYGLEVTVPKATDEETEE